MSTNIPDAMQRLIDRADIADAMCRYARGVDRGAWELVRSGYHVDAYDDHGDYKGDIDGLIIWLDQRFAGVDNSMHLLGNSLIEFASDYVALVETYFVSRRLRPLTEAERALAGRKDAPSDAVCREAWGRYVDRFERRDGDWRVAHRLVVLEQSSMSIALGGARGGTATWGQRDADDPVFVARRKLLRP